MSDQGWHHLFLHGGAGVFELIYYSGLGLCAGDLVVALILWATDFGLARCLGRVTRIGTGYWVMKSGFVDILMNIMMQVNIRREVIQTLNISARLIWDLRDLVNGYARDIECGSCVLSELEPRRAPQLSRSRTVASL